MIENNIGSEQTKTGINYFSIGLLILGILILGALLFLIFTRNIDKTVINSPPPTNENVSKAILAGTVTYSSLHPDPQDQGSVAILIRPGGSKQEFIDSGIRLGLQDTNWKYLDANLGKNYEVQAILTYDGVAIANSTVQTVTAPALNIDLDFNVNWKDLGLDPQTLTEKTISGKIDVNGYLPSKSQISLIATTDLNGQESTKKILTLSDIGNQTNFTLNEVSHTTNYTLSAILLDSSGKNIGDSSQKITASISDSQINFVINSTATPPAVSTPIINAPTINTPATVVKPQPITKTTLSGRIILNGPLDRNSQLIVLGKKPNESNYQVWQTLPNPNNDGQNWQYDQAEVGQMYDIKVALQVNQNNVNSSNQLTVAAPAQNIDFTLNTNFFIAAPNDNQIPSIQPCNREGGSNWGALMNFPKIDNAGQYWVQVGEKESFSNYYNQKATAKNGNFSIKISNLPGGKPIFVRYTYSICRGCVSDHNFAPWSRTISFTCE